MTTTTAPATWTVKLASEKQMGYVASLIKEREIPADYSETLNEQLADELTSQHASRIISDLLALPKRAAKPAVTPAAKVEVTEGMYLVGASVETGRVFRVVTAKTTGNLYAKQAVKGGFEYVPGAMNLLRREGRALTAEEAGQFGHLFSFCCCCGKELSNPESVALGIGPVCRSKWF